MFGDLKRHGFDLESTMLHTSPSVSPDPGGRYLICLAYLVWRSYHPSGWRHLVDRHDRRDLSIFQIGLCYIQRRLTNAFSISIQLCSYL